MWFWSAERKAERLDCNIAKCRAEVAAIQELLNACKNIPGGWATQLVGAKKRLASLECRKTQISKEPK